MLGGIKRRLYISTGIICTLTYLIYRTGNVSGPFSTAELGTNNVNYPKGSGHGDEDSSILPDMTHPSVFQQWRELEPRTLIQTSPDDTCRQLQELTSQRSCSQRLEHVKNYCSERQAEEDDRNSELDDQDDGAGELAGPSINDSVVDVFSYRQGKKMIMYCSVHKVASTFWLRIFRFLHNDIARPVSCPEALSKYVVHLTPFRASRPFALAYITRKLSPEDDQFRFMFTRNPYRRLWSVYIDKFVLPDFFFWSFHARAIKEVNYPGFGFNKSYTVCFSVSFEEFVRYVVQDPASPSAPTDDHMVPLFKTCNPCTFQPHFIGRLENMSEDSEVVLNQLGLSDTVQPKDFTRRVLDQIRTVTEFVHETVVRRRNLRHCVTDDDLQKRLIRGFILSGYFPPDAADSVRTSASSSLTKLLETFKDLFLASNRNAADVETQKNKFFVEAYDSLPFELLLQVKNFYEEDFSAFGYDPEPWELFAHREDT